MARKGRKDRTPQDNLSLDLFMKQKKVLTPLSDDDDDESSGETERRARLPNKPLRNLSIPHSASLPDISSREIIDVDLDEHVNVNDSNSVTESEASPPGALSQDPGIPAIDSSTPVRNNHGLSIPECYVSWEISPQVIGPNIPSSRVSTKSHSFSASQHRPTELGSDSTPGDAIRDPETDLYAKFTRFASFQGNESSPRAAKSRGNHIHDRRLELAHLVSPRTASLQRSLSLNNIDTKCSTAQPQPLHGQSTDHSFDEQSPPSFSSSFHKSFLQKPQISQATEDRIARLLSLAETISNQQPDASPYSTRTRSSSDVTSTKTEHLHRLREPIASPITRGLPGQSAFKERTLSDIDIDMAFDLSFSDFSDSDMPPAEPLTAPVLTHQPAEADNAAQALLPITPLSVRVKGENLRSGNKKFRPMSSDNLFSPVSKLNEVKLQDKVPEEQQQKPDVNQNDDMSDFDDSMDEDLLNDLMEEVFINSNTSSLSQKAPSANVKLDTPSMEVSSMDQAPPSARTSKRAVSETTLVEPIQAKIKLIQPKIIEPEQSPLIEPIRPLLKDFRQDRLQRTRTSTQEVVPLTTILKNPNVHRYLVTEVSKRQYIKSDDSGNSNILDEVCLVAVNHADETFYIQLRDGWLESVPAPQHVIHIVGQYEDKPGSVIIVDNDHLLLVILPDSLITCTSVSESFFCHRKIILRDRLRSGGGTNIYMVYGSIIHEVFQSCLAANEFTDDFTYAKIDAMVEAFLEELYLCEVDPKEATEYLRSKSPAICKWGETFISPTPKPYSFVDEHRSRSRKLMSVSNIIDVEEEVWSPTYGLKGKIDVTVETCLQDAVRRWKFLSPLEIKSSKNTSIGHRAQTTLYTLLLSDRYGIDIKYGVLVYSETGNTIQIPGLASEIRDLLIARNQLALAGDNREDLPPMIENERMCRMCERMDACMTFHCVDNNASITHEQVEAMKAPGILTEYDSLVGHVTPRHASFFNHWNKLLTLEEKDLRLHLKEIWTMTSTLREAAGRCFARVKVQGPPEEVHISDVISKYTYVLERENPLLDGPFMAQKSLLSSGDPIIVSDESGHIYLASGLFTGATRSTLTITVNRRLTDSLQKQPDFNEENNQAYNSLMSSTWMSNTQAPEVSTTFRIDKDEFGQAMGVARNNLVQLLLQKSDNSQLGFIVDLNAPRFLSQLSQSWEIPNGSGLNVDQAAAIQKCLSAQDYALILGMPGTGKTTTIAAIIEILVAQKKTVLLASYTHSAVDTILRKIKDSGFEVLRLGRPSLVNPEVRHFAVGEDRRPRSKAELEQVYMKPPVVASTCLGISHWLFDRRKFDYCIVDEASQVTLPTCLGPIRYAEKFVLVGDHFQLSPLVKNPDAQDGGLDVSLFKRLNDAHPESVVNLTHQYRMCEDIMMVSNRLIYDGRLKCGSEEIANQSLHIPNKSAISDWKDCWPEDDWIEWVLKERLVLVFSIILLFISEMLTIFLMIAPRYCF